MKLESAYGLTRARGFSLVELMVSMVVSLIAVAGMIALMSSTLGSTTRVIETTRLSSELRGAMQVLTRELRRANFDEDFIGCIGIGDQTCTLVPDTFNVSTTTGSECFSYSYRRQNGGVWADVNSSMRLNNGVIEFNPTTANCAAAGGWTPLTDGDVVGVTEFEVTPIEGDNLTYTAVVSENLSMTVRKIRIHMTGQICRSGALAGCTNLVTREVESVVRVRNDILFDTP